MGNDNTKWMQQGACLGMDPDLFFPERGESTKEAKAVCAGCPVRARCLEHALVHCEKQGIWGGTSERERREMRFSRSAAPVRDAVRAAAESLGRSRLPICSDTVVTRTGLERPIVVRHLRALEIEGFLVSEGRGVVATNWTVIYSLASPVGVAS